MAQISFNLYSNYMQMAICRSCECLELNKLKSPLKCRRVHSIDILAWSLLVWYWVAGDCSLGLMWLKAATLLWPLRHASFCFNCICDAVFLLCLRDFCFIYIVQRWLCGTLVSYNKALMSTIFEQDFTLTWLDWHCCNWVVAVLCHVQIYAGAMT